ncbi:hypothetical protein [Streptomyces johnsoniae]|uniref:Lipoprotein n=1 Tax=Streptomyces johnsoniae TaxID=3075532 RepID=A0ABU2SEC1_9ACTN|nr:hypothetical protein [Streptomyces sp. DSM 41886]MDT0447283.1 hypothetical protein [Streptomyces sp. DSM 41886]
MSRSVRFAVPVATAVAAALLLTACDEEESEGSGPPPEQSESESGAPQEPEEETADAGAGAGAEFEGYWQSSTEPDANLLLIGWDDLAGQVTYLQGTGAGPDADLCTGTIDGFQLSLTCMRGTNAYTAGLARLHDDGTLMVEWVASSERFVPADDLEDTPMEELADQW